MTALHWFADHPQAVAALLAHGADPQARSMMMRQEPLHMCTSVEAAAMLLDAGAWIDAQDGQGQTILHLAVGKSGNWPLARLLIDRGANPLAVDNNGRHPLHWATTKALADLLMDAGADPHARDRYGFSPCDTYLRNALVSQHIAWRVRQRETEEACMAFDLATAQAPAFERLGARL